MLQRFGFCQVDAHQRIMRTGRSARGSRRLTTAHIALGRLHDRLARLHISVGTSLGIEYFRHPDVFVGARRSAGSASDADRFVDLDNAGFFVPSNRPGWTADHANRIAALHAGLHKLQPLVRNTLPDESRVAIVCTGTCFHAIVATRASMQIDHHRLTTIVQAVLNDELEQAGRLKLLAGGTRQVVPVTFAGTRFAVQHVDDLRCGFDVYPMAESADGPPTRAVRCGAHEEVFPRQRSRPE